MSYPDSVRYLYSLGNELKAGAKFGLETMAALLAELGNPERGMRFVHVAGTNGKGSVSAMIASVLRSAGWRTGLYTSPHLIEPTERIQIDGEDISSKHFAETFETVHAAAEKLVADGRLAAHPSYFETVTAMAFLYLHGRAQISVIEVGLGGRLDATNVITPELCVITPVSYDHEAYLGNTLESIAAEKAGILKAGVLVVLARQESAADAVIVRRAEELGCPLNRTANATLRVIDVNPTASRFELDGIPFLCPLPGRHQIENAVTAILASRSLGTTQAALQSGLAETRWPGRLERLTREPDLILDGAHNPAGARALAAHIREFYSGREVWLVYGAMRDKAVEEVTEILFPLAQRLILTAPDFPRALRPEAVLELTDHPAVTLTGSVSEAIEAARRAPPAAVVFVTGSLYLVGEARKLLLGRLTPVS